MLHTLAIENYRSLHNLQLSLGRLTVVTGANGSGKSNLYRALRLLSETVQEGVVHGIAREGGLDSCLWAGPEQSSASALRGESSVEGLRSHNVKRIRMGFAGTDFSYAMSLGMPEPDAGEAEDLRTLFGRDPQIKREVIWSGPIFRPAAVLVERKGPAVRMRDQRGWRTLTTQLPEFYSLFDTCSSVDCPEVETLRQTVRNWRFYDYFRTDFDAPARQPQLGTRTPILHGSGRDIAAALQTIREIGDPVRLDEAIDDAFKGAIMQVIVRDGLFVLSLRQPGMLRPLLASELSDGTLRYLLLVAALLTPRPPSLMVLNEPENSLHPDLLPALARLITKVAIHSQVWIVSHSSLLVSALEQSSDCTSIELEKHLGRTRVVGQSGLLSGPAWNWPS